MFITFKNINTSDPHVLLLNLTDKIDLKKKDKYIVLSNLRIYLHGKITKSLIKTINLKFSLQHGMEILNYLIDRVLYQIFKIIWIYSKKAWRKNI